MDRVEYDNQTDEGKAAIKFQALWKRYRVKWHMWDFYQLTGIRNYPSGWVEVLEDPQLGRGYLPPASVLGSKIVYEEW